MPSFMNLTATNVEAIAGLSLVLLGDCNRLVPGVEVIRCGKTLWDSPTGTGTGMGMGTGTGAGTGTGMGMGTGMGTGLRGDVPSCKGETWMMWRLASTLVTGLFGSAWMAGCDPVRATPTSTITSRRDHQQTRWRLVYHEAFDAPFNEPEAWIEDSYGDSSPYHVDAFDEDGAYFVEAGGDVFVEGLRRFRSFRKSYTYGRDGWLTVEAYGRDADRDGAPESGGRFVSAGGKAHLKSLRHYDAAILRSTRPLPSRYRVEVTVSNIRFGGVFDNGTAGNSAGGMSRQGKVNGYDGGEMADPWRFRTGAPDPLPATTDNGVYFLCITDYDRPAPHNNVFIHHHRKVVMDTDNNVYEGASWSEVWNPMTQRAEEDGSHYISMIWLDGESFGSPWTGNSFTSYTPGGWRAGPVFADKYLDGQAYVFSIERDGGAYTMRVSGRFYHGGETSYEASRPFRRVPVTWHYNQTPEELQPPYHNETLTYLGQTYESWPKESSYPDYFFFGDPHINYYEGTAEFDDLKLYLPEP